MKKIYIPYIVFCIIIIALLAVKLNNEQKTMKAPHNSAQPTEYSEYKNQTIQKNEQNDNEKYFIIKANNNIIYVFDENENALKKLSIDYDSMREYDKKLFTNGIKVNTLNEVYALIEDFTN